MGHEMAHATGRHGAQRVFQQQSMQALLTGASLSMGDMDYDSRRTLMGLLGAGAQYGLLLPFSRDHETEADRVGLMYMARAGYDPREAVAFWQRMDEAGGGQQPEFASTHPSHGTRIANLRAWMPEALAVYQAGGTAERAP
jgi:metalloendopeptidase OMA1, mitochondrial